MGLTPLLTLAATDLKSTLTEALRPAFLKLVQCMIHIGPLIESELHHQERTVTWLAGKLYCDRTNIYKIFKKKSIDTELLLRISVVLHYNFFDHYKAAVTLSAESDEDNPATDV